MPTNAQVDDFYVSLGSRVQRERKRANLSQAELAKRLDLTRASIANLEAGRQRPSALHAAMLADILDVPIQDLLPRPPRAAESALDPKEALRERARSWAGSLA